MKLVQRIFSFILVITMIVSTMAFSTASADAPDYTPDDGLIVFNSQDAVDKFIRKSNYSSASHGVSYSYDETENALRVEVTGSDPYIYINCYDGISKKFNGDNISYFYSVYKAPRSNSSTSKNTQSKVYLCTVQSPTPSEQWLCHWSYNPISADQYVIARMDVGSRLSGKGYFYGFRYDFFQDAQVGDVIYIDSIIINTSRIPGVDVAGARTALHNGYPVDPSSIYLCREYDVDKYTSPFWKGDVVYNEAVCPIANSDGSYTYKLMYEPDEIIYVYDGTFSRYFEEGKDFTVSGNKITILNSGKIDRFSLDQAYSGDKLYFESYLNVTYTHSDTWDYVVPENKSESLPNTSAAIKNNESFNVVFFGDSLAGGANSSSYRGYYPNAPYWWEQIEDCLRENYNFTNLNVYDVSEGGSTASGMINTFRNTVLSYNPDLIFIEFGVNDAQNGETDGYKDALRTMIYAAKGKNENCEIVLVSPFYSNTEVYSDSGFEVCQTACLELEAQYDNVVCADITAMHKSLRAVKRHYDITGDNVCHPNDYFSRVYAQVCLATIIPEELGYDSYPPADIVPEITEISPENASIEYTGSATFTATATGYDLSYSWDVSNLPECVTVTGADSDTLTISVDKAVEYSFTSEIKLTITDKKGNTAEKSAIVYYTGVVMGDLSNDSTINSVDLFQMRLIIKQIKSTTPYENIAADINGDGKVTSVDMFDLKYRILKGTWR
ncbi:MAG: hypothetical protein IKK26_04875 [Clostridia bacterium]|nr:hypothetical protein [Clostridia bacterium]